MTSTSAPSNSKTAEARAERFPREKGLPSQSPLFWVEQKDRYLRQLLIRDIEELTQRRLAVYYANRFQNAQIDAKDPAYMAELLGDIADKPVDLLLETAGGNTDSTEALVSLIQNLVPDLRVIFANAAKSNGTLLCLMAHTVVMGCTSELGPIEPSVQGVPASILIQPEIAAKNFALHKTGEYALQQTQSLASRLLANVMMKGKSQQEIDDVVKRLSSRDTYASHGSVIDHREATALGLNVTYLPPGDEVWERIWLLYCIYEHDCRKSNYLKIFEGQVRSTAISVPPKQAPAP